MKLFLYVYLAAVIFNDIVLAADLSEVTGEYCNMEVFQPNCRPNEIIAMKQALYGRMKIGRCVLAQEFTLVSKDETTLGCFSNVLNIMDNKCSGKTKCEIRIPDNDLELTKPCYLGLIKYLQADYECLPVVERDERSSCSMVATTGFQYIRLDKSQSCGSASRPWTVETSLGKTIQLTMYDFRLLKPKENASKSINVVHANCFKIGSITDKSTKKQEVICDSNARHKTLFNSNGNVIEVVIENRNLEEDKFLLGFKATGCSDIIPTEDSWMKRDGNSLTVGCYSSRKTWTLTCQHDKWIGTIGNCSHGTDVELDSADVNVKAFDAGEKSPMSTEHQTLVIIAIVGFGLVVCLTIVCAGIVCVHKCYSKKSGFDQRMQDETGYPNGVGYYNTDLGMRYPQENGTNISTQYKDGTNSGVNYEESKYFILDQEPTNEKKTLA